MNPNRWSSETRNWEKPDVVYLNPLKEKAVEYSFVKQAG